MKYKEPEMEVIILDEKDAVLTSDGMNVEDLGPGMEDDLL